MLLSGNEAVALGAWQAGCSLAAAYPGTPSSEILPALIRWAERHGGDIYCEWSVNEKVALEVASGASIAGARTLAAMKHVGLNVAADPFFTLAYTGVEGGLLVISADDPGLHSSQNEQDNRIYARHAGIPMLEPADSQEACDFARLAFELSERFDVPVLLRLTTRVSHSRTPVVAGLERAEREVTGATPNPQKYVMVPAHAKTRHEVLQRSLARVARWGDEAPVNRVDDGVGDVAFIASGLAYCLLREVLPEAPVLKLGMTYPLPGSLIGGFVERFARVVVVEELEPFLFEQIRALGHAVDRLPAELQLGELTPDRLVHGLRQIGIEPTGLSPAPDEALGPPAGLPARPPVLCPGCAHRAVFAVLRKLKVFVTGDIGCYTLATLEPLAALHTCLDMGAGISQAHGISRATGGKQKAVAVIGDSTFTHMGMPALLNAIYNGGDFVTLILDNRSTAMTGGQDHPGTGTTLRGESSRALDFARLAEAMGAEMVMQVPVSDPKAIEAGLRQALNHRGPAVVIASGLCPLRYRVRTTPYAIDREKCTLCRRCLALGCPALGLSVDSGLKWPVIDAALCNGCGLCAQECLLGAISLADANGGDAV
ncbi:MAG TPA: thiamine pyrophosphate-dependent enzyme [Armatimonadota bacterium]|nr:thiamine pyrophosphate-dependent enzyme [Armatimonadota bacterium]HQK93985.1 thiamine pyrophosphate-dependent enzyme [Armatimonadota bacterium]